MAQMKAEQVGEAAEKSFIAMNGLGAGSVQVVTRDDDGKPLLLILLATCPVEIHRILNLLEEDGDEAEDSDGT